MAYTLCEMCLQGIMVVIFFQKKPIQNDEYNYRDSLQAHLSDSSTVDLVISTRAAIANGRSEPVSRDSFYLGQLGPVHFSPLPFIEAPDI